MQAWRCQCSGKTEFGKPRIPLGTTKEGDIFLQVVVEQLFAFGLVIYKKSASLLPVAPESLEEFN